MRYLMAHMNDGCCFPWPFAKQSAGYPHLYFRGRTYLASRIVCAMVRGDPPLGGLVARHTCGRGHLGCFNSGCLIWGTFKENTNDMRTHGTMATGERVGTSKLSAAEVDEIRMLCGMMSQSRIAIEFGVSQSQISNINLGKRWSR